MTDAVNAIREVSKLTQEVKRVGEALKDLAHELREHDRRITRLEAQWETPLKLYTGRGPSQIE